MRSDPFLDFHRTAESAGYPAMLIVSIVVALALLAGAFMVVGSRGLSGFRSALLGSISNAVVQRSARPVVVVHDPADHGDP